MKAILTVDMDGAAMGAFNSDRMAGQKALRKVLEQTAERADHRLGWNGFDVFDSDGNRVGELRIEEEAAQPTAEPADVNARMLHAVKRALPWLGLLIANDGHLGSVLPNDAVHAMNECQAIVDAEKAKR